MKKAFIPEILRPDVVGSAFSLLSSSNAVDAVESISNIDEIAELYSRRKIIAKIVHNISSESEKADDAKFRRLKLIESIFLKQNKED